MLNIALLRPSIAARLAAAPTGVPGVVFYENEDTNPDPGTPHLTVAVRHLTHSVDTFCVDGGHATDTGRITFTYYGLNGEGTDAFDACSFALQRQFASGTRLAAGTDTVRVSQQPGPFPGDILLYGSGFSYQQLTVPWYALVRTAVLA